VPVASAPVLPKAAAQTVRSKAAASDAVASRAAAPRTATPVAATRELPRLEAAVEPVQRPVIRAEVSHHTSDQRPSKRNAFPLLLAAVVVAALSWFGIRMLRTHPAPTAPAATQPATEAARESNAPSEPAPVAREQPTPRPAPPAQEKSAPAAANVVALHEVLPEVSSSARRTIRGTIRVSVRVIIEKDGTVFAALAEDRGPSQYFERKALEAAKKWTFTAADTDAQRIVLLRFNFTRDGATARLVTPR
jgi:TonB family protein